jgi:hypothetical protein
MQVQLKILTSPIKRSRSRSCDCKIIAETGASGIASMGKYGVSFSTTCGTAEGKQFLQVKSYWFKIKYIDC